jgi:hypothetical protein
VTLDRAFTDGAYGAAIPIVGQEVMIRLSSGQSVYALVEARAAYTPANAEVFTIGLDLIDEAS